MALTYGSTWPVDRKYVGHSTLSFYGTWPHTTCSHNSYTAPVLDSMSSRAVNDPSQSFTVLLVERASAKIIMDRQL